MAAEPLFAIWQKVFFYIYILWNQNYNNKKYFLSKFSIFRTEKILSFSIMLHFD